MTSTLEWIDQRYLEEALAILEQLPVIVDAEVHNYRDYFTLRAGKFRVGNVDHFICLGRCNPDGIGEGQFAVTIERYQSGEESWGVLESKIADLQSCTHCPISWNPKKVRPKDWPEVLWHYDEYNRSAVVSECSRMIGLLIGQ